ncbi:hypothetical protein JKP88DRAFT_248144 [Tribonema minus]|uniref:BACK domain-containing protein n=1 Tax=Tribonema minus TaxID=303371 RepID=A0A835YQM4_9STRA|nr:hypothetical protein JKP88DRAFT_248144 [Tribonema minus]
MRRAFSKPLPAFSRMQLKGIVAAMLEKAGDLEVAMNDDKLREQLALLPESALVALLSDDRLAVAAESTVVAVALQWAKQRGQPTVPDAIANCIRLKHLEPGFAAGIAHFFPQWTQRVLSLVFAGRSSPAAWQSVRGMYNAPRLLGDANERARPGSAVVAANFKCVLLLRDLAAVFEHSIRHRSFDMRHALEGGAHYGGFVWLAFVAVHPAAGTSAQAGSFTVAVGVAQEVYGAPKCVGGYIDLAITVTCAGNGNCDALCEHTRGGMSVGDAFAVTGFFGFSLHAWDSKQFARWADGAGNLNFEVEVEMQ